MTRWILLLAALTTTAIGPSRVRAMPQTTQTPADHVAWAAEALKRMQTIKPGMTREDLLRVFTTEGGIFTARQRRFVSRDCPLFKVIVTFETVARPGVDSSGRVTTGEKDQDVIVDISRPFLEFSIMD